MNRKQFIQSHGATCRNWNWSWSFINEAERLILFGAWDRFTHGRTALVLSEEWKTNGRGRKSPGYDQSREHIRLIEEEGYQLMTFPMKYSEEKFGDDGVGPAKIEGFEPQLSKRSLIRVGGMWYAGDADTNLPLAEELLPSAKYPEGSRLNVSINAYERNAKARSACIAHHGLSCSACGFDFARVYGSLGQGFIHVHHVIPIGKVGIEYEVDPVNDLVPVCPNCHAMIHRTEPPLLITQIAELLQTQSAHREKEGAAMLPSLPTLASDTATAAPANPMRISSTAH